VRTTRVLVAAALLVAAAVRADEPPATLAAPPAAPAPVTAAKPGTTSRDAPRTAKADRLDLDPTAIRGNQELPKVLYIVPWKDAGPGEPAGRPLNSLIDEALSPVDREVFRRQVTYFGQLYAAPGPAAGSGGASP
jgi:hypothetical protein